MLPCSHHVWSVRYFTPRGACSHHPSAQVQTQSHPHYPLRDCRSLWWTASTASGSFLPPPPAGLLDCFDGVGSGFELAPKTEDEFEGHNPGPPTRLGLNLGCRNTFSGGEDDFRSRLYRWPWAVKAEPGFFSCVIKAASSRGSVASADLNWADFNCGSVVGNAIVSSSFIGRRSRIAEFRHSRARVSSPCLTSAPEVRIWPLCCWICLTTPDRCSGALSPTLPAPLPLTRALSLTLGTLIPPSLSLLAAREEALRSVLLVLPLLADRERSSQMYAPGSFFAVLGDRFSFNLEFSFHMFICF